MTGRTFWICVGAGLLAAGLFFAGALKSPIYGVAALVCVAGMLAVIREPGIGMGFLTFLLPLERMQRITNDDATFTLSIMRFVALGCLGAITLHRIYRRKSLRVDPSMAFYGVYVLLAILGLTYTTDPSGTKRFLGTILANCLFLFLYYNYFQHRHQLHLTIALWLAANVLGAAYSAYDWHRGSGAAGAQRMVDPGKGSQTTADRWGTVWEDITEWDAQEGAGLRRSMGPTSHPSVYGLNLVLTVPFYFYLMRRYRKAWQQLGLWAALGLTCYNILLANTRGAMIAAVGSFGLCFLFRLVTLRRHHILALLVGLAILAPLAPKDALSRILDPKNYTTEKAATLRIRLRYWDAGARILQKHFLFGLGVGNERAVPDNLEGIDVGMQSVHNIYIQVAIETGFLGWAGFFTFVGLTFYFARTAARNVEGRPGWEHEYYLLRATQVTMLVTLGYGLQVDVFNFPLKGWWLVATMAIVMYRWTQALPRLATSVGPGSDPGASPGNGHHPIAQPKAPAGFPTLAPAR